MAAEANHESDEVSHGGDSGEESELRLHLQAQGPGLVALGASSYADNTQAVAPRWQRVNWLQLAVGVEQSRHLRSFWAS